MIAHDIIIRPIITEKSMAEKCAEELRREHRFCKVAEPVGRQEI